MKADIKKVTLTIDGREITVDDTLTILEAARRNGIIIPTLCHHPALSSWGGCRLCVVQVDQSPKLAASCVTPVRGGMEVVTNNATIIASRRLTLEFLFAERNHNCMFCPSSGECELQQMAYALQMDHLTVSQSFTEFPVDTTSKYMSMDHNRCILCGRCVRACKEIAGSHVLGFHNRGGNTLVGFDLLSQRAASSCTQCGACLQVCPTGALSNRYRTHLSVSGQPTDRTFIDSVCAQCGLLCPTRNAVRDNQLIKVDGIYEGPTDRPDRGQLCHKGRFEVLQDNGKRLLTPIFKDDHGQWQPLSWNQALAYSIDGLKQIAGKDGADKLFGLISTELSNEVLYLFKEVMTKEWNAGYVDTLDGNHYCNLIYASTNGAEGNGLSEDSWKKIATADMVLLVNCDLQRNHSLFLSMLHRAFVEKKLPIVSIGETPWDDLCVSRQLRVTADELPGVLSFLSDFTFKAPHLQQTSLPLQNDRQNQLNKIAGAFALAKAPFIIVGDDVTRTGMGLAEVFKLARPKKESSLAKSSLILLKPATNSMAAWRLGTAALKKSTKNALGGIVMLREEEDQALAPFKSGRRAPDFLVVIAPYLHTTLAEIAHVMLPNPLGLEEDGTYGGLDGTESIYKIRLIDPPGEVWSNWDILQALRAGTTAETLLGNMEGIRRKVKEIVDADSKGRR